MLWLLQAGISCADRVVTVSPGYAWEIQTPEGGWGMEGMLTSRSYALNGVLNGVDLVEWDPENDPHIYQNYGETSFTEGKRANKAGLQKEMGLPQRPEVLDCLLASVAGIKQGSYELRCVCQHIIIQAWLLFRLFCTRGPHQFWLQYCQWSLMLIQPVFVDDAGAINWVHRKVGLSKGS